MKRTVTRRSVLKSAITFAAATFVHGGRARAADDELTAAIDRLVERQGFEDDGPGIAVSIYQPGKINFRKGYGLADLNAATPITPRTLFELASVSKQFTATAVLILADRGKLALADDIRAYLPELPQYPGGPILIRQLLRHSSGLPDYLEFDDPPKRHADHWDNEDYVRAFAAQRKDFPAEFTPGARYEYNNSNYLLAATIVARASGKTFGAFLREAIFDPVGMKHSFVFESPAAVPRNHPAGYNRALGYSKGKNKPWRATWGTPPAYPEKFLACGDGGVWSNLEDMHAWDAALRAGRLLRPETMKLALTPFRTRDGKRNDYGFGWELEFDKKGALASYGHDGSWDGFRTSFYRDLTQDRSTILLSNRGNFDTDAFWNKLDPAVERYLADR